MSDVPPGRGIWWPRVVLHQVSLTFTVRHKVSLTLESDVPPVEASSGQDWYYVARFYGFKFFFSFDVQPLER